MTELDEIAEVGWRSAPSPPVGGGLLTRLNLSSKLSVDPVDPQDPVDGSVERLPPFQ